MKLQHLKKYFILSITANTLLIANSRAWKWHGLTDWISIYL